MKWTSRVVLGLVAVFVVAQVVPYGRAHENPAVVAEPQWSSPHVRELAERACFDCHSNESRWPWYVDADRNELAGGLRAKEL
jgi:hypothetical protein